MEPIFFRAQTVGWLEGEIAFSGEGALRPSSATALYSPPRQVRPGPGAVRLRLRGALGLEDTPLTEGEARCIAFNSAEAVQRILDTTIANIQAFRTGTPQNQVHD